VLIVYDTEVIYYLKSALDDPCPLSDALIDWTALALFYSGAVFDPIHLNDLDRADLSPYRLIVFANTFRLDEQQKNSIATKVAAHGRHLLWVYAPGYIGPNSASIDHIAQVTGIQVESALCATAPIVEFAADFEALEPLPGPGACEPLIQVCDPDFEVLGTYQHSGRPAFGCKNLDSYTAWYIGVPPTAPELFRCIYRRAGVHLYTEEKDVVYAGSGIVALHTRDGGDKTIALRNGKIVRLALPAGPATVAVDAESGQLLLD
jgi:hypothetical protein